MEAAYYQNVNSCELEGVHIKELNTIQDSRGHLTEIFKESWNDLDAPVQWNCVESSPNVLRGFHLHVTHVDFLYLPKGKMRLGLKDLRPESKTYGQSALLELEQEFPKMIIIEPGIGHGFYFPVQSTLIYGLSHYWHLPDEFGCRWNDENIDIDWGLIADQPILSDRDANAHSFDELMVAFKRKWQNNG